MRSHGCQAVSGSSLEWPDACVSPFQFEAEMARHPLKNTKTPSDLCQLISDVCQLTSMK